MGFQEDYGLIGSNLQQSVRLVIRSTEKRLLWRQEGGSEREETRIELATDGMRKSEGIRGITVNHGLDG